MAGLSKIVGEELRMITHLMDHRISPISRIFAVGASGFIQIYCGLWVALYINDEYEKQTFYLFAMLYIIMLMTTIMAIVIGYDKHNLISILEIVISYIGMFIAFETIYYKSIK